MRKYFCCDESRREAVRDHSTLNGIEYLEVVDSPSLPDSQRQRKLMVHFLKDLNTNLNPKNVSIEGGVRVEKIRVVHLVQLKPDVLEVEVDQPGDFSTYRLRLVMDEKDPRPPTGFDPLLSMINFSFKAACPSDFDCKEGKLCPPQTFQDPPLNYLAKDYASFRQLMLDRISQLMPRWKETSPADLGITLVEMLAYVGDYLSYKQDAVATEAYLGTARSRVSVRRHARLVDYRMHDGCNARTWVQVEIDSDTLKLPQGSQLFTKVDGFDVCIKPNSTTYRQILEQKPIVFESMERKVFFREHNRMAFYTWGDQRCCLPEGATKATLKGRFPALRAGDVLIFLQERDPETGTKQDADLRQRHAVRLTHVKVGEDPLGGQLDPDLADHLSQPVTDIVWADEDALPFPICISSTVSSHGKASYREDLSLALGNIILVDHGRTLPEEDLGTVSEPRLEYAPDLSVQKSRCQSDSRTVVPPRFRPQLGRKPLTQAVPLQREIFFSLTVQSQDLQDLDNKVLPQNVRQRFRDHGVQFDSHKFSIQGKEEAWSLSDGTSAFLARKGVQGLHIYRLPPAANRIDNWGPDRAKPAIKLISRSKNLPGEEKTWLPVGDLLNSGASTPEFVVEVETEKTAYLRFGDDTFGRRPETGDQFIAHYRKGNGTEGNVGAQTIFHLVTDDPGAIKGIWNPLPARGGVEPEDMDAVRQLAPFVFRRQERAVTLKDYQEVAGRHAQVQRAAAAKRWTGSWNTTYLFVDRVGGRPVDKRFRRELRRFLEKYRLVGDDLQIVEPHYVPLEIELEVCLKSDYLKSDAAKELLRLFSAAKLPTGERGVFHPDNFTFGQPVYLSQLYAVAARVEGILSYELTVFQRLGQPSQKGLDEGKLTMNRLEVARLDNDPNFPEHGVFRLKLEGGR